MRPISVICFLDARTAQQWQCVGLEDSRLQRFDAVDHHVFALVIEHAERQVLIETAARDDLGDRIFGEIIGLCLKIVVVDIVGAIDDQISMALIR